MLVAIDYYSKWPEAAVCETVTSSAVIAFLNQLFDRFGLVESIVTDNGAQYVSSEFETYLTSLGIRHLRSALYAPQANAEVERFNRVMKEGLRAGLADGQSFMASVRHTLAAYRTTPQATTGVTPASLMLSFPVRTPLTLLPQSVQVPPPASPSGSQSSSTSPPIAPRVRFRQQSMSIQHDRRHRSKVSAISAGDMVRIRLPNRPHKLAPFFSEPQLVNKAAGNTVWLANGQRWNLRRCLLHKSMLKQSVRSSTQQLQQQPQPPPLLPSPSDGEEDELPIFTFPVSDQQPLRRSQRRRRQRDFGPVISH
jgi:hypothetical protein